MCIRDRVNINNGKLEIIQEGKVKKFVNEIEQITFNGKFESKKNKKITIVTERAAVSYTHLDVYKRQDLYLVWQDRIE